MKAVQVLDAVFPNRMDVCFRGVPVACFCGFHVEILAFRFFLIVLL